MSKYKRGQRGYYKANDSNHAFEVEIIKQSAFSGSLYVFAVNNEIGHSFFILPEEFKSKEENGNE